MAMSIANRFDVGSLLGRGSFGKVYECIDRNTGDLRAVKLEEITEGKFSQLTYEYRIYNELGPLECVPRIYFFGVQGEYRCLVMDLLDRDLEDVRRSTPKGVIPIREIIRIGSLLIHHIREIHSKGFLHRDLKPQNIMCCSDRVFLMDFGLAKKFVDGRSGVNMHVSYRENKKGLAGTPRYASARTARGIQQSRRDDIESLCYVLVYLATGALPWVGLSRDERAAGTALRLKESTTPGVICQGLPDCICMMLTSALELEFDERPPYERYVRAFKQGCDDENIYI